MTEIPESYRCKVCGTVTKQFTVYCTMPGCHGRMYISIDGHDETPKQSKDMRKKERER